MMKFIAKSLNAARKYNLWDFACLKITLLSLGILVGTYFSQFFLNLISIIWVVFILTYVWIMYQTFIKYMD